MAFSECDIFLQYGTRHIIETMKTAGHSIDVVYICGGLVKNELFVQLNADILGNSSFVSLNWLTFSLSS